MKLADFFESNCVNIHKFARKCGVTHNTIYRLLNGEKIRMDTAMKIAMHTNGQVSMEELLDKKEPDANEGPYQKKNTS